MDREAKAIPCFIADTSSNSSHRSSRAGNTHCLACHGWDCRKPHWVHEVTGIINLSYINTTLLGHRYVWITVWKYHVSNRSATIICRTLRLTL